MRNRLALGALVGSLIVGQLACRSRAQVAGDETFDTVVMSGRVMDPESGLDAVRNIGIREGRIAVIADSPLRGREVIDARGLVVAPGFIDLHAHGQTERDARLQAQDGVTTALDMEVGVYPAAAWYAQREGRSPIHFGASAGHMPARIKLKDGVDLGHHVTNPAYKTLQRKFAQEEATDEDVDRLMGFIEQAIDQGALGVGLGIEYVPVASRMEILRAFQVAARHGVCAFVHVRSSGVLEPASGLASVQEAMADAAATGACLHLVHITSVALSSTATALALIEGARAQGRDISTEVYPYTAASTRIESNLFSDGWQRRLGISYRDLQWPATGERLTEQTFRKYREQRGWVIIHSIPAPVVDLAIKHPAALVASDAIPFDTHGEHPRGSGTFSRVLGYYVRERGLLSLMEALRKMTLQPAQRLERFVPQMRQKGRLRVGADADISVFDAATIADRGTYEKPMVASAGIAHVMVNGTFIVKAGKYVEGVYPGKGIRRPQHD
jgi:dihydroorotase